ncbi:MAG TPA: VOC family protein [Puia sp.]|nr:VOC family protein [Puia sp.]
MTRINAYLNFNGRCREAMKFYQECLGGELTLQRVSESPMAAQLSATAGANILHSVLVRDGLVLMGSDMLGDALKKGNEVMLCLQCSAAEELYATFERLAIDGQIRIPLHQTVWGATYGELTDKFGMHWRFHYSRNQSGISQH